MNRYEHAIDQLSFLLAIREKQVREYRQDGRGDEAARCLAKSHDLADAIATLQRVARGEDHRPQTLDHRQVRLNTEAAEKAEKGGGE